MAKILIYDSGVGNRPIADAIRHHVPQSEIHLVSDTAYFPYGEKTDSQLLERVQLVLRQATETIKPDILVLACNTLSTIALDGVRKEFDIPVVGVVPAIKPAARASQSNVIGLLATPATINRQYISNLVDEFAADCQVIKVGSTDLVKMAEEFYATNHLDIKALTQQLEPFIEAQKYHRLDQLVLGCTHFPLLKSAIADIMQGVQIQDSSDAIGKQVLRLVSDYNMSDSVAATHSYKTGDLGDILSHVQ